MRISIILPAKNEAEGLRRTLPGLRELLPEAELFVVIAYGKILPSEVLAIPEIFCVNVHGSLLPKYRGAAPINWAILNGDKTTGVTVIKLNEMMDAGEIISQRKMDIADDDTAVSLKANMARLGAELLLEAVHAIQKKAFKLIKQDLSEVTYAPKLTKELGIIKWNEKAKVIHDYVRGLLPWPGAFFFYQGKRLRLLETRLLEAKLPAVSSPGSVLEVSKSGILVSAADRPVLITRVHPEGGKPMAAHSFAMGYKIIPGHSFG